MTFPAIIVIGFVCSFFCKLQQTFLLLLAPFSSLLKDCCYLPLLSVRLT